MPYSAYTDEILKEKFGIEQFLQDDLFADFPEKKTSSFLTETLEKSLEFALSQKTEKARSEFIIAPVFLELREQTNRSISIFSGIKFDVDKKQKLDGVCDFLISRSPYQVVMEAPVVVAVEAKRQDFEKGISQCIAEMIAARIFNERRGKILDKMFGCVTTGDVWRFLYLQENKAFVDTTSYNVRKDIEKILGILFKMAVG